MSQEKLKNIEQTIRDRRTSRGHIYPTVGDWVITWHRNDWRPQEITAIYFAETQDEDDLQSIPPPRVVAFRLQNNNMYVFDGHDYNWFGGPLKAFAMFVKLEHVRKHLEIRNFKMDWAIDTGIDPSRLNRHEENIFGDQ